MKYKQNLEAEKVCKYFLLYTVLKDAFSIIVNSANIVKSIDDKHKKNE